MSQTFKFSMCECLESCTLWGLGRWGSGVLGPKLQALGPKLQALATSLKPHAMCILSKLLWKATENHPNVGDPPWGWALHNFNALPKGGTILSPPLLGRVGVWVGW